MNRLFFRMVVFAVTAVILASPNLMAQSVEVHPYGGYIRPSGGGVGEIKDGGIYGLKLGFFLDPSFQLEGNFGYINHFEVRGTDPKSRGLLWEMSGVYNFAGQDWPLPSQFTPNISVGVGGLSTRLSDPDKFTFTKEEQIQLDNGTRLNIVRPIEMSDGDTFFNVSMGGGIKTTRIAGPFGLRFDIKARVLPNYYGSTPVWLEATGGINFVWGD
jgi:hypothetical protein